MKIKKKMNNQIQMSLKRRSRTSSDSFSDNDFNTSDNNLFNLNNNNNSSNNNGTSISLDKRKSRNENEKKRRDIFNSLIDDLSKLHNHEHKKDKSTILLDTLNYFKVHNNTLKQQQQQQQQQQLNKTNNDNKDSINESNNNKDGSEWRPPFLDNNDFINLMCEFKNSFYLVFDLNTTIKYVSDDITRLIGHIPKDIEGRDLTQFIGLKSAKLLQTNLKKRKFNNLDKISFNCTWKHLNDKFLVPTMPNNNNNNNINNTNNFIGKDIKISGYFKSSSKNSIEQQLTSFELQNGYFITIASLDSCLEVNQIYLNSNELIKQFNSQLSMNLKYTNIDTRATQILGYTSKEMLDTLGYDYVHVDDLDKLVECHKQLIKTGASTSNIYRFRTKGNQWILLRTHFNLIFNPLASNNTEPQSIFCTNNIINIKDLYLVSNNQLLNFNNNNNSQTINDSNNTNNNNDDDIDMQNNVNNYQDNKISSIKNIKFRKLNSTDELLTSQQQQQQQHQQTTTRTLSFSSNSSNSNDASNTQQINVNNKDQFKQQQTQQQQQSSEHQHQQNNQKSNTNSNSNKNVVNNKVISKIILMSYKQPQFRKFVCSQLKLEREKAEEALRQQTLRLKEIEQIINFFQDDDKLEKWVNEVRKSIINNNQQTTVEKQQQEQERNQQQQQQQQQQANINNANNQLKRLSYNRNEENAQFQNNESVSNTNAQIRLINSNNNNNQIQPTTTNTNALNVMMNLNDDLMIDDIDVEVLDRLLEEYSFKSFNFFT